jgi:SOS-response transcriptional repressor LexA
VLCHMIDEERINDRLRAVGMTKAAASRLASAQLKGKSDHNMIARLLSGVTPNPRPDTLNALATVLQCSVGYLTSDEDDVGEPPSQVTQFPAKSHAIPVVGKVQAGSFFQHDYFDGRAPRKLEGPRHHRHPNAKHVAYEVVGDSMNDVGICDGDFIFCVAWDEIGYAPMDGLIVVVEQSRSGQERERSVKQIEVRGKNIALVPRSSNPNHKEVVFKHCRHEEGQEVRIIGLVYGKWSYIQVRL